MSTIQLVCAILIGIAHLAGFLLAVVDLGTDVALDRTPSKWAISYLAYTCSLLALGALGVFG